MDWEHSLPVDNEVQFLYKVRAAEMKRAVSNYDYTMLPLEVSGKHTRVLNYQWRGEQLSSHPCRLHPRRLISPLPALWENVSVIKAQINLPIGHRK